MAPAVDTLGCHLVIDVSLQLVLGGPVGAEQSNKETPEIDRSAEQSSLSRLSQFVLVFHIINTPTYDTLIINNRPVLIIKYNIWRYGLDQWVSYISFFK